MAFWVWFGTLLSTHLSCIEGFAKASYADLYMNLKHILSPPSMWERNYTPRDGGEGGCNIIRLS